MDGNPSVNGVIYAAPNAWAPRAKPDLRSSVTQGETDALYRLRQDRTPPGQPIRDYPLARPMVAKAVSPPS